MGVREARKILDDFLENTSCHGLNQIRISKKVQAVAWLTCSLIITVVCFVHLANIVKDLQKKDVIVQPMVRLTIVKTVHSVLGLELPEPSCYEMD